MGSRKSYAEYNNQVNVFSKIVRDRGHGESR